MGFTVLTEGESFSEEEYSKGQYCWVFTTKFNCESFIYIPETFHGRQGMWDSTIVESSFWVELIMRETVRENIFYMTS